MLGFYLLMVKADVHMNSIVVAFGLFIIITMSIINHVYRAKISTQSTSF